MNDSKLPDYDGKKSSMLTTTIRHDVIDITVADFESRIAYKDFWISLYIITNIKGDTSDRTYSGRATEIKTICPKKCC